MFEFEYLKETIAVFLSKVISDHKWVLKLSIPSNIISGSNWENLKHIELHPIFPYAHKKVYLLTWENLYTNSKKHLAKKDKRFINLCHRPIQNIAREFLILNVKRKLQTTLLNASLAHRIWNLERFVVKLAL